MKINFAIIALIGSISAVKIDDFSQFNGEPIALV